MKITIATAILITLTGCANLTSWYDPHWVAKNAYGGNNRGVNTMVSTPQGNYTVRTTSTGTVQVYRAP